MDTLSSFPRSSSSPYMDVDVSMFMDTSQEFEPSQGGVVRWVASQSTNPALQALMREAERDRKTRPSTPVDEPMSWTYPFTSTTSSTSLSTSASSAWHASGHNLADTCCPSPLSGSSSSASFSSSATRASGPSVSRRAGPLSATQQRPLASSTSPANQPTRRSVRPRSSSHSTLSSPSTSKEKYTPRDDEPEALHFVELLKETSKQVDENAKMKQQVVRVKGKGKKREESLEKSGDHTDLGMGNSSARALAKAASVSAVCDVTSSTRAREKALASSMSAYKPDPRRRAQAKEPSLGGPNVTFISGKSTPTSLPNPNLNCDIKSVPGSRPPAGASDASNANHATRKTKFPQPVSNDGDSAMQDVVDLTETDTEWVKPISGPISRADTTMCMDLDDEESDTGMGVSFYKPEPPPRTCAPAPKPKPHPPQPTQPAAPHLAPTQRTRTGPPPLGMRRAPQLQPSQYDSTQGSRAVTVPRFKPPLLANAGGSTSKSGSGTKPATMTSSRLVSVGGATKAPVAEASRATPKDPDSSFDVSFDMDADALEEAMKAYD